MNRRTAEDDLIRTMRRFLLRREKDGMSRINGELPHEQRKIFDEILRKASNINGFNCHE